MDADPHQNVSKNSAAASVAVLEHVLGTDEVNGSNPVSSAIRKTTVYSGCSLVLWGKNHNQGNTKYP